MKKIFLSKSKLAIMFVLIMLLMLGGLNHAFAFRAPDTQDKMETFKAADANSSFSNQGIVLESKPMLKSILHRNLNKPVKGDAVQAAKDIVQNLMSTGFVGFIEGQQSFNGEQQSLTRDGSGIANNLQTSGIKAQLRKTQFDNLGYQHIRIAQTFHDLPVVGAETIVHINNNDIIYQINGKYLPDIKVSVEPSIDSSAALKVGLDEQEGKPGLNVSKEPSLVIYGTHLAYHYVISHEGADVGQWWYYVDAHTGKLIYNYNNIKYAAPVEGNGFHTNVSGNRLTGEDGSVVVMQGFYESSSTLNYFLYNFSALWGIYDEDAFDWEQQATSNWGTTDRAAISAGQNFEDTQAYVSTVLGRNSFNDAGAFARANVHTGTDYVNAYWDGTDFHFGDGDGVNANALTTLDIAGHEYGHALTSYTSDLIYSYESGALNEAYSDILGSTVEFYIQPDGTGSYPGRTAGHDDWLMGEDCWLSDVALRDIRDPQRFGLPSYYKGTYWYYGSGDNGGVHYNNGPACFAYYLLAVGGSGTNDGHPYGPITGIGEVNAAAVALRANYYYHVPSDQYADAREHWISAASDLGFSTTTVEDVWTACGVEEEEENGAGDVIQTWTPASNTEPWGIAYTSANTVWVGNGWSANATYEYQPNGTATGNSWSYTWSPANGPADSAFNWNTGMVWTLDVGGDNALHEMNPSSGFTGNTISGPWSVSQRGLAYDPDTDTWFVGGWNDYTIYHINSSGTLLDSSYVGLSIAGLAYNPDTHHLFVMENAAPNNIIHVLDTSDNYSVVGQFTIDGSFSDYGGAGLSIDIDRNLWAVDQVANLVYQINSGESAATDCTLINDGSFENGPPPASAWTEWSSSGMEFIVDPLGAWGIPANDGTYAFWGAGYYVGPNSNYVEQSISIPGNATTLNFMANFYRPDADDVSMDYFYVKINGATIFTRELIQANDTYPSWAEQSINISAYAGQTVTLRFEATSAGDQTGNVLVDYVRTCTSSGPGLGDELAVDFAANGLWHYNGSAWTNLAGWNPDGMVDWNGGMAVDFDTYGAWNYDGTTWSQLAGWNPEDGIAWNNGLAVDFGPNGLWHYDGSSWASLATWNPDGMGEWTGGLAVNFGAAYGLWNYDGSSWSNLAGWEAEYGIAWNSGLAVDFGSYGLWYYDGSSWTSLAGWNPDGMVEWTGGLAVDFGSNGLWSYDGSSWTSLAGWNPEDDMVSWTDGIAVDFGSNGLWSYDGSSWTSLAGWNPQEIEAWTNGLAVDFGASYGLWNYDGSSWSNLAGWDSEDMIDIDLY